MKIVASAPGKLVLFGEHAVVYGYPCIGVALDKRVRVSVETSVKKNEINTPGVKKSLFVEKALELFRERFDIYSPIKITTSSDFTDSLGLGSSSAVSVATIASLTQAFSIKLSRKQLFDMSYEVVLSVQGTGSGFDVATAVYGGYLYYEKKGTTIKSLSIDSISLLIAYSGVKADTITLVNQVKRQYDQNIKETTVILENITDVVHKAKAAMMNRDWVTVGSLMTKNHHELQKLGVSTHKLDTMIDATVRAGAYGAKLSGAGGGDCIIAIVSSEKRGAIEEAIKRAGGELLSVSTDVEGVKIEN